MQQPHGALPHDDHFHVRIACPGHMTGCVENPVVHGRSPAPPRESLPRGRRGPASAGVAIASKRAPSTPAHAPAAPADSPAPTASDTTSGPPAASMAAPADELDE
jgi:hypothetical protein